MVDMSGKTLERVNVGCAPVFGKRAKRMQIRACGFLVLLNSGLKLRCPRTEGDGRRWGGSL